ncbi:MAG TPA: nucleotidyl transferase AbiEii/AbiGii toxin family protein [Bacteroidales bacterium]|jgi:predicted nucleotidyltransferase component of viral defense system|nr:nucleotidyl transferase AbiEii/AbiGii toxin family protein [Bacteroidales bacterium]HQH25575.1 nucleotidyl transferase AbiEii/AbiGii toxin family protein [Bacteroidales bacterium]HQJ82633.1 nucleotidyl transferase AbiEii/AbiGii toxin family protein [Bacteroidales bacterium]
MIDPRYRAPVELLLQTIPYIAKESIFSLKGGTAINLFIREMPRLSVDIDLTYMLIDDRETALKNISDGLNRIKADLEKSIQGIWLQQYQGKSMMRKLIVNWQMRK